MKVLTVIKQYKPTARETAILSGALLLSIILTCVAAYHARYAIGSDGISYISIAQQYARGELATAVNGYWSPLTSWLLVPLIKIGADPRAAFVLLNALAAIVATIIGGGLVWRYARRSLIATLVFVFGMTLLSVNSVGETFPDMIVVAWTAIFISAVMVTDRFTKKPGLKADLFSAATLGLVGAFGYLTKLYAAPFFIVVLVLWTLFKGISYGSGSFVQRVRSRELLLQFRLLVLTGVMFVAFCMPWVIALSVKYNYPTFGSSFAINTAPSFKKPKTATTPTQTQSQKEEVAIAKKDAELPTKPPHDKAVTTTEDRTPKDGVGASVGVRQSSAFSNFIQKKSVTIPAYLRTLHEMWILLLPIIIICTIYLAATRPTLKEKRHYYFTLLSFAVYFGGYSVVTGNGGGNPRYFWPMIIFSLLLACFFIGDLLQRTKSKDTAWRFLGGVVTALVITTLVAAYPVSWGELSAQTTEPRLSVVAEEFKARFNPADYDDYVSNNGRENRMFAYYVTGQAYGTLGADHQFTDSGMLEAMNKRGIDYFLHFTPSGELEFNPADYGGRLLFRYDLGSDYRRCKDTRDTTSGSQCYLYVIKPVYR